MNQKDKVVTWQGVVFVACAMLLAIGIGLFGSSPRGPCKNG